MIKIGINKNIFINTAVIEPATETSGIRLKITFEEAGGTKYANAFERLNADEAVETLPTRDIIVFAPFEPQEKDGRGNKRTEEQKIALINTDITSIKAILQHILLGYMELKDAKFDMYEGLGVDANNYNSMMIKKATFTGVAKNMFTQFIDKMKPFFGKEDKLFRLLLVRQDAANAYPTLRKRYIGENPFWESMDVDEKATKVAFTPYELKEKLNDDMPASRKDADKTGKGKGGEETTHTAESVFGG